MDDRTRLRIFLSSPGDTAEERQYARGLIEANLSKDPFIKERASLEVITWDDPAAELALPAHLSPQETVDRTLTRPSECDIVVVIFRARMGTPLPLDRFSKPDGEPYLSGTEYEFEDALRQARKTGRPTILLYRHTRLPVLSPEDPDFDEACEQYGMVQAFFARFRNADGSFSGSHRGYATAMEFRKLLEQNLRQAINDTLKQRDAGSGERRSRPPVPAGLAAAGPLRWRGEPYLPRRRKRSKATPPENRPHDILSSWIAMEILSPRCTFQRPDELLRRRNSRIDRLDGRRLPWPLEQGRTTPDPRIHHHVVLGALRLDEAMTGLRAAYDDENPNWRIKPSLFAPVALLALDARGRPVEGQALSLSSLAWALPHALGGTLSTLGAWPECRQKILAGFEARLRGTGDVPLDADAILGLFEWLRRQLNLHPALVVPPWFAIRSTDRLSPVPLETWFIEDLIETRALLADGHSAARAPALSRYFRLQPPPAPIDLLQDGRHLAESVAPARLPPARWPGRGRHSLVLLQQAAVNSAVDKLADEGLFAVNGPPGTGKTTLLRDLVAATVTRRAEAMCAFDDPESAFRPSGEEIRNRQAGQGSVPLFRLNPQLKGFEILVASSNNNAVENISHDLPLLGAVAEDAPGLRYFKSIADSGAEVRTTSDEPADLCWGLIAAALGKAENRAVFDRAVWSDEDRGLKTYLAAAAGVDSLRDTSVAQSENPPRSREEALHRWDEARQAFREALHRSRGLLAEAEVRRQESEADDAVTEVEATARRRKVHDRTRPGWLARLLRSPEARVWRAEARKLDATASAAQRRLAEARREIATARRTARGFGDLGTDPVARFGQAVDSAFLRLDPRHKHRSVPWLDGQSQRVRDEVFIAAMAVHKAFVDAAAEPLRHNLDVLISDAHLRLGSQAPRRWPEGAKALVPDLWASLFLVVPVISTTFASVRSMLGGLPDGSLGWVVIDEAGQATPQSAVGALMRARRAIAVGDPFQVEPVTDLPERLSEAICREFSVDPNAFAAPAASVQSLADAASPVRSELRRRAGGPLRIGAPLVVHRRCADPMFRLSNRIAYEDRMVHGRSLLDPSRIRDTLGPSHWIDVRATGPHDGKWNPAEGEVVWRMLSRLVESGVAGKSPDLYLLSPFAEVSGGLFRLLRGTTLLHRMTRDPEDWLRNRIGTVHTFQGREAEAVILVLGAGHHPGARRWAGQRPNVLNVAATRAKEALYVVGSRSAWKNEGCFGALHDLMPDRQPQTVS